VSRAGRALKLTDVDIYDPDLWAEGVPHETFRYLRANAPVFWQEVPEGRGYWALTKHADVMAASADPETFSAARGGIIIEDPDPETLAMLRTQLLSMDPPEHVRMRKTVVHGLTPSMVAAMEPWLRERSRAIMDAAADKRDCDFIADLAKELPLQAITEIMGVPHEDRARLADVGDRIIGRDDPDVNVTGEAAHAAATELGMYGYELAGRRKDGAGSDLISILMNAEIDGHRVDEAEFAGLFVQIAVAGNETTRTLLAGGMLALLEHPAAYRELERDFSLMPSAIEEMLRWVTPVHYFRRTATRDTAIRGQRIREGERVVLLYASANRDEDVFDEPDRFHVRRDANPHLAFGWGEHFCLGAKLARLEARVFLEEFFRRFAKVELTARPVRVRSNLNNAYREIPVRLTPR